MNPKTTGLLFLAVLAIGAFIWFYELGGEEKRLEAEESGRLLFADVGAEAIDWIELRTRDGVDARFEKRDERWQLVSPLLFPADPALERMTDTLAALVPETSFEDPQPDAEYGLDEATARRVRFGTAEAEYELRLGRDTPVGSNVYARVGEGGDVYTLARFRTTPFDHPLADLREKRILDLDVAAIREIEASWPGGRVELVREVSEAEEVAEIETSEWRLRAPLEARADAEAVDDLLSSLAFLRADAFVDAPGEAEAALFDPPDFEVRLATGAAEAEPLVLALSRAEGERRLVRTAGSTLYAIPAERIVDLPREVVAYRYRKLTQFPLSEAERVEFFFQAAEGDPVAITASRGAEGWVAEPEAFAPGKLSRVVSELSRLEADDILAEELGVEELEALGLSPPNTIMTVLGAATEDAAGEGAAAPRLAELHFGNVTPDGIVARRPGEPTLFRLALEKAEHLPVSLDVFRSRFRASEAAEPPIGSEADPELATPFEESP